MASTNKERIAQMLELLQAGLLPFVQREMESEYRGLWLKQAAYSLNNLDENDPHFDVYALLKIMWDQWNNVFSTTLGHAERSLVSELRSVRNQWAHQETFSGDDAYRALDSAARLLTAISAPEAREVERMKQELLRIRFDEQARRERRKAAMTPTEGKPSAGLRPWRELVTPHPDVASGRYQQAEFAADLAAVHDESSTAGSEYRDPQEFFRRTYLTEGLRDLLRTALLRIGGQGGDPVVELKTNFGGGKTHSMLALYHLFSGAEPGDLAGVDGILHGLEISQVPKARRAVLVGTALSPGQARTKPDGTVVRTLWGELAWQLGGAEAFALVADTDAHGVSPGSHLLRDLFVTWGPALVLIDEWVAYARQIYGKSGLPAGSFDANLTFVQALTEAVKQTKDAMLVASLPASQIEIGGEGGQHALALIQNTFARIEATWRPASAEESFEIVRRRLFQPMTDPNDFAARDAVIDGFARLYRDQAEEFPAEVREADYTRRMQAAYPIHPELFDRLYSDWSSLERFQRTRGVLRLMASVIHALWERNDGSLLIMPATIPIDEPEVQKELTRYLEDNWVPVLERDVDGPASLPLTLDRGNPNFGRYSACRRVARAIYMGSAPTYKANNRGIDDRGVKLGCVQPGETVATFGDALRRLTDQATHLYVDRSRYWFSTQPSVTRLAQDRAAQVDKYDAWEELKRRLRSDRSRGDFAAVHVAPAGHGDVPDETEVRLVVLGPESPHMRRSLVSSARQQAELYLRQRGSSPRLYRNMLVFLAPDQARLDELEEAIAQYLAWKSIFEERKPLNLDPFQTGQAESKLAAADETVDARIRETYTHLLAPYQSDPHDPDTLMLEEHRIQGNDALAVVASRRLVANEGLFTVFGGVRLKMELDKLKLMDNRPHIGLKQLWEYFARYPYMPRLRDVQVFISAVQDGVTQTTWSETFAYAAAVDEAEGRYRGLLAGQAGSITVDSQSVLVRSDVAKGQTDVSLGPPGWKPPVVPPGPGPQPPEPPRPPERRGKRFHGAKELDPMLLSSEAAKVAENVLQFLSSLPNASLCVTLEIEADLPDGVPEHNLRTILENARTLGFSSFEFEDVD